ncbi:MAG: Rid family hydrolase [Pseudomonadota bacterium]
MPRRINVDSGRPLEAKAQYSRALRVDDLVVQSGTTAIDLAGEILGETVVEQIEAILEIAGASMAVAEGRFEDVIRVRAFVVGRQNLMPAAETIASKFDQQKIVCTLIPTSRLARPTQLVELEFEAIDDSQANLVSLTEHELPCVALNAIRLGKRIFFSGGSTGTGDGQLQTQKIIRAILSLLNSAGAARHDLTALRIFVRDRREVKSRLEDIASILDGVKPVISVVEVSAFAEQSTQVMIEAEAFVGARSADHLIPHPCFADYAMLIAVEDQLFLSNIEPLGLDQKVLSKGDWGAQRDQCLTQLESLLGQANASLKDVINRRYFTQEQAEQNRAYGDGPAWFKETRPAALGCRIANHLDDGVLLTVEAHAIRGAGDNIIWRTAKS